MAAVGGWTRVSVYFSKSHGALSTHPVRPHVPSMNVPVKAANVTPANVDTVVEVFGSGC